MKLQRVEIENYRAIRKFDLTLDSGPVVFHGGNGHDKTSVLRAIATGLGSIPALLPGVSGVGFRKTDMRGLRQVRVALTATDGVAWDRRGPGSGRRPVNSDLKKTVDAIVRADRRGSSPVDLPIVAFYGADRAAFDRPRRRRGVGTGFPRYAALEGALSARTDFRDFFAWLYAGENGELGERPDFNCRLDELDAVRRAVEATVPGVSDPRIERRPLRFAVSVELEGGVTEELSFDRLGGGGRIVLAVAADLARRMARGNPHLDDPLRSEAIVLIDEVELHLHPSRQQRILADLGATFPNAQFIVSTYSPQVLTTVRAGTDLRTSSPERWNGCRTGFGSHLWRRIRRRAFDRDGRGRATGRQRVREDPDPLHGPRFGRQGRVPKRRGITAAPGKVVAPRPRPRPGRHRDKVAQTAQGPGQGAVKRVRAPGPSAQGIRADARKAAHGDLTLSSDKLCDDNSRMGARRPAEAGRDRETRRDRLSAGRRLAPGARDAPEPPPGADRRDMLPPPRNRAGQSGDPAQGADAGAGSSTSGRHAARASRRRSALARLDG